MRRVSSQYQSNYHYRECLNSLCTMNRTYWPHHKETHDCCLIGLAKTRNNSLSWSDFDAAQIIKLQFILVNQARGKIFENASAKILPILIYWIECSMNEVIITVFIKHFGAKLKGKEHFIHPWIVARTKKHYQVLVSTSAWIMSLLDTVLLISANSTSREHRNKNNFYRYNKKIWS